MAIPPHYDNLVYPTNIDSFLQMSNGNGPDNIVDARLINKVQNALTLIESHTQYTCDTPTTTGYYMVMASQQYVIPADLPLPGQLQSVNISVAPYFAANFFSNNPFSRNNAVFVTGVGYHITGGVRNYFQTRAAANVVQENGNLTLVVNVIKNSRWLQNDVVEAHLMLVRLP